MERQVFKALIANYLANCSQNTPEELTRCYREFEGEYVWQISLIREDVLYIQIGNYKTGQCIFFDARRQPEVANMVTALAPFEIFVYGYTVFSNDDELRLAVYGGANLTKLKLTIPGGAFPEGRIPERYKIKRRD